MHFADITDLVQSETPELYDFIPEDLWKGALLSKRRFMQFLLTRILP